MIRLILGRYLSTSLSVDEKSNHQFIIICTQQCLIFIVKFSLDQLMSNNSAILFKFSNGHSKALVSEIIPLAKYIKTDYY